MQMTIRQFIKNYADVINQHKLELAVKLAKGQIGSMEQYNRAVGRSEGLDQSVQVMRDMMSQLEEADQDSDLPEMKSVGEGT